MLKSFQLLASNDGALRNLDSSMFNTSGWPMVLVPVALEVPLIDRPLPELKLWLNICQGTGINLPVRLEPLELLGIPETLDRLEGTVSRPEVDVSATPPAFDSDKMANWTRPLCGSTTKSRMYPKVLPSCDCTLELIRLLSRTALPELIEPWLEPKLLDELRLPELLLCPPKLEPCDCEDDDEPGVVDVEPGLVVEDC